MKHVCVSFSVESFDVLIHHHLYACTAFNIEFINLAIIIMTLHTSV